jgi:signal transduction histidine kinase
MNGAVHGAGSTRRGVRASFALPIRWRIAAASTLATLVLLVGAGLLFITTLGEGLQASLDRSLRSSVNEFTTQLPGASTTSAARIRLADNTYGQILGRDGTLKVSTTPALRHALLPAGRLTSLRSAGRFFDVTDANTGAHPHERSFRVLAVPVRGSSTVAVVGASREVVDEATDRAAKQLLVLGAAVLLAAAAGSWLLARSALKPVERMRAQAAALQTLDAGGLVVSGAGDEIQRLAVTLNELLARLHTAVDRERSFVADAGHELRTPLTVLRGELELAQRPGRSPAQLAETISIASEETERLIRLAEDLLVLARNDGPDAVRWTRFDVSAVLNDARARTASIAAAHGVTVRVQTPPTLLVDGDPDRIRRAVDNLLANALRFAPSGTEILVAARSDKDGTTIEVADAGPGFSDELLPVAFERFRRDDKARTRSAGTHYDHEGYQHEGYGLGLAIVRSIMRAHGGDATAENRADGPGGRVVLHW